MDFKEIQAWTQERNIDLIAVSKTRSIEEIQAIYDQGHRDFGENRAQELLEKVHHLPSDLRWHMVGTLQSNKIKSVVPHVHMIHSVERLKTLRYINREARKIDRIIDILIQIHIAEEESKHGFTFAEAEELFRKDLPKKYPHVRIRGLMGMATLTENEKQIDSEFRALGDFYRKIQEAKTNSLPHFDTLSMGMTNDFQLAVANGATMIRVGRLIFGERIT